MRTAIKLFQLLVVSICLLTCSKKNEHANLAEPVVKYTCPMHPQIVADKPGTCPICGMELVPLKTNGSGSEIMLSDSQIKLANITTTLVKYEDIGSATMLTGKLAINEEQTQLISSRVAGRIEKLTVKEVGQRISKGQVLYEIYSEQLLTLKQEYLLAVQQVLGSGNQDTRNQKFLAAAEQKLILYGLTKTQVDELGKAKTPDSKVAFLAPVSGIVARMEASEGQYVSEGASLYRIEQLDKIWVEADLYPKESTLIKIGDVVEVSVSGFENIPMKAKVTFVSPEYRAGSQIITLRAEFLNPENKFLPGMQANVSLSHSGKMGIALPVDAIIRDERGSHVWVLNPDGAYASRMVKTGIENGDKVEVTSGLEENENVVITGAYLLYSELVLKKGGDPMASHSHF